MNTERKAPYKEYLLSGEGFGIAREVPRCISACPAGCDVHGYLRLVEEGRYREAYQLIMETIPLPASIGRICHHPCEMRCRRSFFDAPIAIAAVKRFVGDYNSSNGGMQAGEEAGANTTTNTTTNTKTESKTKRVAIIGAGPAGLTAAFRLASKGYAVKVYERLPSEGGMLLAGIPPYRLPKKVLKEEVDRIKRSGVEMEVGKEIDKKEFERLRQEYDAIFIAVGMQESRRLGIEGEDLEGVVGGIEFLRDFNLKHAHGSNNMRGKGIEEVGIGQKIAVIGGGNVAMDVARCLIRLGSDVTVTVVYRRSREEMPASVEEVREAEEEGVKFLFLANPTRILGSSRVERLELIRMKLGAPDESGRRQPVPIKGSRFSIDVDMVIPAVGQASDLQFLEGSGVETVRGLIKVDEFCSTTVEGIFAGGDCVHGAAFAVDAIADGNVAADSIDRFLNGVEMRTESESEPELGAITELVNEEAYIIEELKNEEKLGLISRAIRCEMPEIDIEERKTSFKEVKRGLSQEAVVAESGRCMRCRGCLLTSQGLKAEISDADAFIARLTYVTGVNKCAECGECTASCPVAAIDPGFSPRKLAGMAMLENADKIALSEEIWSCISCGICNTICPYGVDFLRFIQGVRTLAVSRDRGNVPHYSEQGRLAVAEISATERLRWLDGVEGLKVGDKGDVYYFSGCISFLDHVYHDRTNLRLLDIARSAVRILNSIGIVPAVNSEERCCGHDLLWLGDEKRFQALMRANIELIKSSGAKIVVFSCAECLRTFDIDYRRFYGELGFEVMHISEFLKDKHLDFDLNTSAEELITTYHDPCRLSHLGIYDAPRAILARIPGVKQVEMAHNREHTLCCGVSGLLSCSPIARVMQMSRLAEAEATGASKLIVTCPKCWIHLDCALENSVKKGRRIEIEDLTSLLAARLKF